MFHFFSFVLFLELIGPTENIIQSEEDTGKGICKYIIFRCCRLIFLFQVHMLLCLFLFSHHPG